MKSLSSSPALTLLQQMDGNKWEKILTCFQASARGYLVRKEVFRAQEDFEDVVREIDGGLAHLKWKKTIIPIPHFTDTDGPFPRPCSSASKPPKPGLQVCVGPQRSSAATAPSSEERRDHHVLLEKTEAERDHSQSKGQASLFKDYIPSCSVRGDVEAQKDSTEGDKDGGVMESTGDSTTVWSSLESCAHNGSRQYCLAQEVPRTPEALRLHRNTLTMELIWLQQAIDSRKKYLSLKDRLSVS